MTCLHPDPRSAFVHPLKIMDQPVSGYILDIVDKFKGILAWRLDYETVTALLSLALKYFPTLSDQDDKTCSSPEALVRRLQVAGYLAHDRQGLTLTTAGKERHRTIFHLALAEPIWVKALAQMEEDLMVFAETEGMPLAIA